ncbi:MAG: signal peptidase II [Deltaproteobacteria bacterium]|nr:signal peptidase II [Deltaproteobacteria bacterium]
MLALTVPLVAVADQITKALAKAYLAPLRTEIERGDRFVTVIDGLFRLKYTANTGAAWGMGREWGPIVHILISLAAIVMIVWFVHKLEPRQKGLALSFSLVLGGAVGNVIDRIYMHEVIDFIDWYVAFDEPVNFLLFTASAGEHHWPTFNVADVGISIGVVLLLALMIFTREGARTEEAETSEPEPGSEPGAEDEQRGS